MTDLRTALVASFGAAGARHARILRELVPGIRIVGLRRPGQPTPQELDAVVHDLGDALAQGPQVAILAGPAPARVELATALASHGVDLLLEKPVSDDASACEALLEASRDSGVTIAVGYNLRFLPSLRALKRAIDDGCIGRLLAIRAEVGQYLPDWRAGDHRNHVSARRDQGGGALLELSHELDYVHWLASRPAVRCHATARSVSDLGLEVEDLVESVIEFEGGVVANVHQDFFQRPARRDVRVLGTEGSLELDLLTGELLLRTTGGSERRQFGYEVARTYYEQMENFLTSRATGESPQVGLAEGVAAVVLCSAIRRASDERRTVELDRTTGS